MVGGVAKGIEDLRLSQLTEVFVSVGSWCVQRCASSIKTGWSYGSGLRTCAAALVFAGDGIWCKVASDGVLGTVILWHVY